MLNITTYLNSNSMNYQSKQQNQISINHQDSLNLQHKSPAIYNNKTDSISFSSRRRMAGIIKAVDRVSRRFNLAKQVTGKVPKVKIHISNEGSILENINPEKIREFNIKNMGAPAFVNHSEKRTTIEDIKKLEEISEEVINDVQPELNKFIEMLPAPMRDLMKEFLTTVEKTVFDEYKAILSLDPETPPEVVNQTFLDACKIDAGLAYRTSEQISEILTPIITTFEEKLTDITKQIDKNSIDPEAKKAMKEKFENLYSKIFDPSSMFGNNK
jgi:hypothetical protein